MEPLPPRLRPFLAPGAPDLPRDTLSCQGELGSVEPAGPAADEVLSDSGGVWVLSRPRGGEGLRVSLRLGGPGGRVYQTLDLAPDLRQARARLEPAGLEDEAAPFCLREPLLELWIAALLFAGRGVLLHAAALRTPDGALHAFVGRSGAGKSTLAGLLAPAGLGELVTDDRLVVRPAGQGFRAWGTPWHGTAGRGRPGSGELRGVWLLEQAPRAERLPAGPGEAALHLAANCFRAAWPAGGAAELLETCARLAERVPCRRLRFPRDPSAVGPIREVLEGKCP
jgi:hypothetical protein